MDECYSFALLRHGFPNLTNQELLEVKETLDSYFDLSLRIYGPRVRRLNPG